MVSIVYSLHSSITVISLVSSKIQHTQGAPTLWHIPHIPRNHLVLYLNKCTEEFFSLIQITNYTEQGEFQKSQIQLRAWTHRLSPINTQEQQRLNNGR